MTEARDAGNNSTDPGEIGAAYNRLAEENVKLLETLATLRAEHDRLMIVAQSRLETALQQTAQRMAAESSVQALRQALVKVRAHTSYVNPTVELLAGLLGSIERITDAALALPGEAAQQPAGSFGYCAICYHPLDRCSHCDAGEAR